MPTTTSVKDKTRYTDGTGLSYDEYVKLGADLSADVYNRSGRQAVRGYVEMPQYRTDAWGVWVDPKTKHGFVVFKGTDTASEWAFQNTNIALNTMSLSGAFTDAVEMYDNVVADMPDYVFDTTGHSLGGAKALYVAAQADAGGGKQPHAIVYNPGVGLSITEALGVKGTRDALTGKMFSRMPANENYLIVRNKDDLASALYPGDSNTYTYSNHPAGGALSLGYTILDQHSVTQFTTKLPVTPVYNH